MLDRQPLLISMLVTPYCTNLFDNPQELYQYLLEVKQQCLPKKSLKILSISQEIPLIDPLAVLQAIAKPDQLHFYFEKPAQKEAIAAINAVDFIKIEGEDRFKKAQAFIQNCLTKTTSIGAFNLPFHGSHFFCSFTFFDQLNNSTSPFPSATIFLPRWQVACRGNRAVVVANTEINPTSNIEKLTEELWQTFNIIKKIAIEKHTVTSNLLKLDIAPRNNLFKKDIAEIEKLKSSILNILSLVESKKINKVVLAHALDVISPIHFHFIASLNHLRKRYPDCYIFSTSNGIGQNFIGASPERLINIHNQKLITDALAGSAPRGKTADEDAELANKLLTSEKERHEHQVVSDFIIQCLSKLGLSPEMSPTPQLLQLLNIQHLWTPIQANVPTGVHPLEIVAELHPTPAVAGTPREISQEQIRRYETFDRGLYAAPLGWVDHRGNSEFIVGIRSALIDGDRARLYAGAGIVAGSDPDKEVAEIQLKLQALLKALV